MNIAEALKLKTAAKAWLGLLAVAAQVALTYLPDHSGYYIAVQILVGVLSIIGIYAMPNKVAEAKDATDAVVTQVTNVFHVATPAAPVTPAPVAPVTDTPAPVADPAEAAPAPVATPIQKDTPTP